MDPTALNYDPLATVDDGSHVLIALIAVLQNQQAYLLLML
jgi:hypothetical protein